jgi:argininosuccinate lyase
MASGKTLETLRWMRTRPSLPLFGEDVYEAVKLENCVELRRVPGGPSTGSVEEQLKSLRRFLEQRTK